MAILGLDLFHFLKVLCYCSPVWVRIPLPLLLKLLFFCIADKNLAFGWKLGAILFLAKKYASRPLVIVCPQQPSLLFYCSALPSSSMHPPIFIKVTCNFFQKYYALWPFDTKEKVSEREKPSFLPHHFIVTVALSENQRHVRLRIWIFFLAKKSATFEKQIEAKYQFFRQIKGKVFLIKVFRPSEQATMNFITIKAWKNG